MAGGKKKLALATTTTRETRAAALEALDDDINAANASDSINSNGRTWLELHTAWFHVSVPALPVEATKIRAIGTMGKVGGYKAWPSFRSKAKDEHIAVARDWPIEPEHLDRKAKRTATRGPGGASQSATVAFLEVLASLGAPGDVKTGKRRIVGFVNLVVIAVPSILCEIEAACYLVRHVHLDRACKRTTLELPVSKEDVRAMGCSQAWDCVCDGVILTGPRPCHAVVARVGKLKAQFGVPLPVDDLSRFAQFADPEDRAHLHGAVAQKEEI